MFSKDTPIDPNDWELDKHIEFESYGGKDNTVNVENDGAMGVWVELHADKSDLHWHTWMSADQAEAMGTLLLFAAQENRKNDK